MGLQEVKSFFSVYDMAHRIIEFTLSSATVSLAAQAIGCEEKRIAKTMAFNGQDGTLLVVAAGDAKIHNGKFKRQFGLKASMVPADMLEEKVGHPMGGVCPFGVSEGITVYLDISLKRFETVYPACGSGNSAIELTIRELERYSSFTGWVDVCKDWQEEAAV